MFLSIELVSLYRNSAYREVVERDMHNWTSPFATCHEYGGVISDIYNNYGAPMLVARTLPSCCHF